MAMIPKRHGPDRKIGVIPLGRCEICQGMGVIKGIFYEGACAACNGSGLVNRDTGEALSSDSMVVQLRLRLNRANRLLAQYEGEKKCGAHEDYTGRHNPAGKGGGNWTGD